MQMYCCCFLQVLNVYVFDFESYGSFWLYIYNCVLVVLFVVQIIVIGYFGIKEFLFLFFLIVLFIFIVVFYMFCKKNYYLLIKVVFLYVVVDVFKVQLFVESIVYMYMFVFLQEGYLGIVDR